MNWNKLLGFGESLVAAAAGGGIDYAMSSGASSPEQIKSALIIGAVCGALHYLRSPKDKRKGNEERRIR